MYNGMTLSTKDIQTIIASTFQNKRGEIKANDEVISKVVMTKEQICIWVTATSLVNRLIIK